MIHTPPPVSLEELRVPVAPWMPDTDECAYVVEVRRGPAGLRVMVTLTWHDCAHGERPQILKMALQPEEGVRLGEALVQASSIAQRREKEAVS